MIAAALLRSAVAASLVVPTTPFYDGMPPARFQGPGVMKIDFGHVEKCGVPKMPDHPNAKFAACWRHGIAYLPNPCNYPNEEFARLACHEKAHGMKWPYDHGE